MEIGLPEAAAAACTSAHGSNSSAAGVAVPGTVAGSHGVQSSASRAGRRISASNATGHAAWTCSGVAAANFMEQLQLAVGTELAKPISEQQFLCSCNEVTAGQYQELARKAATVRWRLEGRPPHQQRVHPLLDGLEAQVHKLEATVAQLDMASRCLQALIN